MSKEFQQISWDHQTENAWRALACLATEEDTAGIGDWTTMSLVPDGARGRAAVVSRSSGIVAGLAGVGTVLEIVDPSLTWTAKAEDGQAIARGERLGLIEGAARGLLVAERIVLNLLGRLSGIATLTRRYVDAVDGTKARLYDTRKTTPGWRRLEKYAVRCGGGHNHRLGLFEAVLIKDNHLAFGIPSATAVQAKSSDSSRYTPAEAVEMARSYVVRQANEKVGQTMIVEIEVDTLEQFEEVLPSGPDIVLLDNMNPDTLRRAVAMRDAKAPEIELEASGGVNLDTVRAIAQSGVDRISVGALTHSAASLDVGLDWLS